MPKLYEYFGVLVMFYANEHEPVHVHGKFQGRESRPEEAQVTPPLINVLTADLVDNFRIRVRFDDGGEQAIDFKPFLPNSVHPDLRAWLDPAQFAKFRIEYGELVWGDYALCFPIIDLYRNRIDHRGSLDAVA